MWRRLDYLRFDDLPLLARGNYAAELRHTALFGVVAGTVEGGFVAIVAAKTFNASAALTFAVWAIPAVCNVLNLAWSVVLRGRRRVPAYALLLTCALLATASIAFTPAGTVGGAALFAAQLAACHLFLSPLITLRTTMWQSNYPHTHRARITGRLTRVRVLVALLTGIGLSRLFDWEPATYRFVFPVVAGLGLLSLWPLRRLRVRGERREQRVRRSRRTARIAPLGRFGHGLREAVSILRSDRLYARYLGAQFLLGSANFFTEPLLISVVTKQFELGYLWSTALITGIPTIVMLLGIRYWAPLFDRVGILRFRIVNSAMWLLSFVGTTLALLLSAAGGPSVLWVVLGLLVLARVFTGLGNGGGLLAWNLGHLEFARPAQTELYMGVHVALTGLRALLMPACALLVSNAIGTGAFAVSIALAGAAHLLFRRMTDRSPTAAPVPGVTPGADDGPPAASARSAH